MNENWNLKEELNIGTPGESIYIGDLENIKNLKKKILEDLENRHQEINDNETDVFEDIVNRRFGKL